MQALQIFFPMRLCSVKQAVSLKDDEDRRVLPSLRLVQATAMTINLPVPENEDEHAA
jgi:hypothetical protein